MPYSEITVFPLTSAPNELSAVLALALEPPIPLWRGEPRSGFAESDLPFMQLGTTSTRHRLVFLIQAILRSHKLFSVAIDHELPLQIPLHRIGDPGFISRWLVIS